MPQARESIFKNPIWVTPPWACAIAWWVASAVSFIGSACWIRLVIHWSSYYSGRLKNPMAHGMPSFNSLILESAGSAGLLRRAGVLDVWPSEKEMADAYSPANGAVFGVRI